MPSTDDVTGITYRSIKLAAETRYHYAERCCLQDPEISQLRIEIRGYLASQLRVTIHSALYLHHVLDKWFEEVVKPRLKGEAYEIRFADDAILCFQHKEDAERVFSVLPQRFEKFGLTLHPEKTRLIEFGRYAARNAKRQGKKQPETFAFLGFTHICARSQKGKFTVHVQTLAKRFRRGTKAIAEWCKQHRHDPVSEQQKMLNAKLRGHYQYYGRPTNYRSLRQFYRKVRRTWRTWLSRRTRGRTLTWERFAEILRQYPLLRPRITHSWAGAGSNA